MGLASTGSYFFLHDHATQYEGLNASTINRLKIDKSKFAIDSGNFYPFLEEGRRVPNIPHHPVV